MNGSRFGVVAVSAAAVLNLKSREVAKAVFWPFARLRAASRT